MFKRNSVNVIRRVQLSCGVTVAPTGRITIRRFMRKHDRTSPQVRRAHIIVPSETTGGRCRGCRPNFVPNTAAGDRDIYFVALKDGHLSSGRGFGSISQRVLYLVCTS